MVVKAWPPEPLVYAGIIAALLLFRLVKTVRKKQRTDRRRRHAPVGA
jgi:sulfoxide reductase heme-binding subunit YedZ